MSEKIVVPVLGESVTEATIAKWLKNVGDTVEMDEPVVELETDKVNLEVPSPVSGKIGDINHKNGDVVEVGAVLGLIQTNGKLDEKDVKKIEPDVIEKSKYPIEARENSIQEEEAIEEPLLKLNEATEDISQEEKPLILTDEISNQLKNNKLSKILSPSVKKIAKENDIDLKSVKGTGKEGQILKGDLINLMSEKPKPSARKIKFG